VLLCVLLVLAIQSICPPVLPAAALSLPWRQAAGDTRPAAAIGGLSPLQEVSPPVAVQQLQTALGGRQPVVEILSPQPDSVLPAGPWTLRLNVRDWPLVDGGDLGIGPHLVVQLDQEPPQIWTRCQGDMPELSPGSHRLTVYAALPWGEARKNPGAARQIRLHRTAANPLALPATDSPQLLAVSPSGPAFGEPLLLDWLLLDAPLQDVGGNAIQWRLRVSINGDDLLLDQQVPLWLRGWRPGVNALRLELLDGRGEPLNPPFNSLVQEVDLSARSRPPRWRGGPLSADELSILVGDAVPGDAVPSVRAEPTSAAGSSSAIALQGNESQPAAAGAGIGVTEKQPELPHPALAESITTEGSAEPVAELPAGPMPSGTVAPREPATPLPLPEPSSAGSSLSDPRLQAEVMPSVPLPAPAPQSVATEPSPPADQAAGMDREGEGDVLSTSQPTAAPPVDDSAREGAAMPSAAALSAAPSAATLLADEAGDATARPVTADMSAGSAAATATQAPATDAPLKASQPAPLAAATPHQDDGDQERIRASTELTGRARDLVNADGSLRRPERLGPIDALRKRLQG